MKVQGFLLFLVFSVASANPRYFGCSAPHIINPIPTGRGRSYALPPLQFFLQELQKFWSEVSQIFWLLKQIHYRHLRLKPGTLYLLPLK